MPSIPNTLPGSTIVTRDVPLVFSPGAPTGQTLMILGQSPDGPSNRPIPISGIADLEAIFGPLQYTPDYPSPDGDSGKQGTFSGNTLVKAAREAQLGGASSILLVRVGGTKAASSTALFGGSVSLSALNGGTIYNGASVTYAAAASGTTVTCAQPNIKGGTFTLSFTGLSSFETIASAVNGDPRNNTFRLTASVSASTGNGVISPSTGTVTLGDSPSVLGTNGTLRDDFFGLTKEALYQAITAPGGTFEMVSGTAADLVTVVGLYADDAVLPAANAGASMKSFLTDFAQFCFSESRNSYPMIGVLGISPLRTVDNPSIAARVNALTTPTQTGFADSQAKKLSLGQFLGGGIQGVDGASSVDIGAYLSLVAGPDMVFSDSKLGRYVDNASSVYAGMLAALPPQIGATNQSLPSVLAPTYRLTKAQRNVLNAGVGFTGSNNQPAGSAYVTFTYQSLVPTNPQLVVTSDVSASSRSSVYSQTQHLRIVQQAEDLVEFLAYQFIGQPASPNTLMTMDSQLQRGLDAMSQSGALNGGKGSGYRYTITPTPSSTGTLGLITITLELRPAYEITSVFTTVSVVQ